MADKVSFGGVFQDVNWIESNDAVKTALGFAGISVMISSLHILLHLKNYSMPQVQLYVIRILLTCPVYAITSCLALSLGSYGIFAEVVRDVYESVVVYSFMHLILEYCGGETDCVYLMENEPRLRLPFPLCCLKPRARTLRLLRYCQRGVLLFILTQPVVASINLALLFTGYYYSFAWQVILTIAYNISYFWALYCLYVVYLAIKQNIKNFRPIAKFASVKSIIFATYYQSLFLQLTFSESHMAGMWNNLLLSIEMVGFATALVFAFPVSEFQGGIPDRRVLVNVKDVFTVRDIVHNVYHNFTPAYDDYALQRSQSEIPGVISLHTQLGVKNAAVPPTDDGTATISNLSHSNQPISSSSSSSSRHCDTSALPNTTPAESDAASGNKSSGSLQGKLGSVAQELTARYRGRSRRMAFNALLRGTQPVRATLRPCHRREMFSEEEDEKEEVKEEVNEAEFALADLHPTETAPLTDIENPIAGADSATHLETSDLARSGQVDCDSVAARDDTSAPAANPNLTADHHKVGNTLNYCTTPAPISNTAAETSERFKIGRLALHLRNSINVQASGKVPIPNAHTLVHNNMYQRAKHDITLAHTLSSGSLMDDPRFQGLRGEGDEAGEVRAAAAPDTCCSALTTTEEVEAEAMVDDSCVEHEQSFEWGDFV